LTGEIYRRGGRIPDPSGAVFKLELLVADIHVRIQRWVVWWIWLGLACGLIAVANILGRDLSHRQEAVLLVVGALHWLLGGLVCWALGAVQVKSLDKSAPSPHVSSEKEWHPASDFVIPGVRHLLPADLTLRLHRH
jgi:hypothetical protein